VKTIAVRDLQKKIRECVDLAQKEEIVITRHGRPAAVVIGVEGRDWEDVLLQRSESFWKLIEARRKESTVTLAEMRKRVGATRRRRPKR
jgi:prevent-host-death family protein